MKEDVKIYEDLLQVYFPAEDMHSSLQSAAAGMALLAVLATLNVIF
jgi:hypothetical protein